MFQVSWLICPLSLELFFKLTTLRRLLQILLINFSINVFKVATWSYWSLQVYSIQFIPKISYKAGEKLMWIDVIMGTENS